MTVVRADREKTPGCYKQGEAIHGKQFRMKGSSGALASNNYIILPYSVASLMKLVMLISL